MSAWECTSVTVSCSCVWLFSGFWGFKLRSSCFLYKGFIHISNSHMILKHKIRSLIINWHKIVVNLRFWVMFCSALCKIWVGNVFLWIFSLLNYHSASESKTWVLMPSLCWRCPYFHFSLKIILHCLFSVCVLCVHVCTCVCAWNTVCYRLHPSYGSQGSNAGHQIWCSGPLPAEVSHWLILGYCVTEQTLHIYRPTILSFWNLIFWIFSFF